MVFECIAWIYLHFRGEYNLLLYLFSFLFGIFLFVFFFRAVPTAYGGSQAKGQIRALTSGLHQGPQQRQIRAMSVTYTTAHCHTGSLTH